VEEKLIKLLKNKRIMMMGSLAFMGLIIYYFVQSCAPPKGSINYGICNTFLEQQLTFPSTLDQTFVEEYPPYSTRIYYKYVDGYGQTNFSYIQCTFKEDPEKGYIAEDISFKTPVKEITEKFYDKERKRSIYKLKPELLDLFNQSNSPAVIMSQDPDLTQPAPRAMF